MSIDDNILRYLFSFKVIRRYILILFTIAFGLFLILSFVTFAMFESTAGFYRSQLDYTYTYKNDDVLLLCNVIGCDEAYVRKEGKHYLYERKDNKFEATSESTLPEIWYRSVTKDFDTIIKYKEFTFVVENKQPIELVKTLFYTLNGFILFFYTGLFININIKRYKEEQLDRNNVANYIEHKLQRNIAEVLHHEMGAPVAVIRSEIEAIHRTVYNANCNFRRACDKEVAGRIDNIQSSLTRLDAILGVMRTAKQLKNTKSCVPIVRIIDSVINSTKCFKIHNLNVSYKNEDILTEYSARIKVGLFSNVIQVMVNNSIEARATELIFSAALVNYNHIDLYVTDNGCGIRDSLGNIIKDTSQIYKYGYSTKDPKGEVIVSDSKFRKFLSFIGITVNPISGTRGIGLNLNKQILTKAGGDISVVETSEYGTTFKLRLHVKKIDNKEN